MKNANTYNCHNVFMVRTPSLPLDLYLELDKKYNENAELLIDDYNLYEFFEENLLISSKNLYESFKKYTINKENGKAKKIKNYYESLLKYTIRSTSRPTPFGGFSKVGLVKFDEDVNKENNMVISKDSAVKKISVDNSWLHYVINLFESDSDILPQLNLKINPLCYKFGNRFKNPFCSNLAVSNSVKNNHIKYSNLIEHIVKELKFFNSFDELSSSIISMYEGIDITIVKDTIIKLIKSEFILTDLRIDLLSRDPLKNLITKLDTLKLNKEKTEIFYKLKELNSLILFFNNYKYDTANIKNIFSIMESIHKSNSYLTLNTGIRFINNKIDINIKKDLEEFVNIFKYLYADKRCTVENEALGIEFQEKYGTNIAIPFIEFIDSNGFNAINKFKKDSVYRKTVFQREEDINKIIEKKVILSLLNNSDEVIISEKDLNGIENPKSSELPTSFDLNVFITKNKDENYNYFIGPNIGNDEGGTTFQRFEEVFDENFFKSYSEIYNIKNKFTNDYYITAEIKEINSNGRITNIFNKTNNYKHFINFGFPSSYNSENEVSIADLSVGVDDQGLFYINYKNEKRIKFVLDNMLNPHILNDVAYILYRISSNYNDSLLYRLFTLNKINKFFIPRIKIGKFTVFPKTWILYSSNFSVDDRLKFYLEIKNYINEFYIDNYVYLKSADNRLIINLEKENYIDIILSELKKNKIVELSEIEGDLLEGSIVTDDYSNKYVSEFVFTFINENFNSPKIHSIGENLINDNKNFNLFSDGWIYIKVYGIGDRDLDVLNFIQYELSSLDKHLFFFIRYTDDIGDHLRIRFKFENMKISLHNIGKIINCLEKIQSQGMINRIIYDVYERETNRYGGSIPMNKAEELFDADSSFVISLLNTFNISDEEELEKVILFGVITTLKTLTNDLEELRSILSEFNNLEFKKKFHNQATKYINFVENIINEDLDDILKNEILIEKYIVRKNKLIEYKEAIHNTKSIKDISDIKYILLSISHMFCNRIYGDRDYEGKILSLSYFSIDKILNQLKYKK